MGHLYAHTPKALSGLACPPLSLRESQKFDSDPDFSWLRALGKSVRINVAAKKRGAERGLLTVRAG